MADVVIIDAATGEVVERDFTPEEIALRKKDEKAARAAEASRQKDEQSKSDARASAMAKLAALGLTEAEVEAMIGR